MAIALWFLALIGLAIATAIAAARERSAPASFVGRATLASVAVAYAIIVVSAIWTWGGTSAARGRSQRLAEGAPVSIAVRDVRVPIATGKTALPILIGHRSTATLVLPGAGAGELARVDAAGDSAIVTALAREATVVALPGGDVVADAAAVTRERACSPDGRGARLMPAASVLVVECRDRRPTRALVLVRVGDELRATPLVWRRHFVLERLAVRAGDALGIGVAEPLPGVTTWEVAAPAGFVTMLAVPTDPSACRAWSSDPVHARGDGACIVDVGAFSVEAIALVPDPGAVVDRGARAALLLGAPVLALLVALALSPRRHRRAAVLGRSMRLALLGAGLVALACWRLAWAYRIDVLRDLAFDGERVALNLLGVVELGGALAGCAASVFVARAAGCRPGDQLVAALGAWSVWIACGFWIAAPPASSSMFAATVALSLVGAVLPAAVSIVTSREVRPHAAAIAPELALASVAFSSLIARIVSPSTTLVKLGLAYALVLAGHAAIRDALGKQTSMRRRLALVGALVLAIGALASYDTGVAVAIAGTGLALAMLVAGHDVTYDASQTKQIGLLEREHARLLFVHASATIAIVLGCGICVVLAGDRALLEHGPTAILHAPLVAALLFALGAMVARSHRRAWTPWLAAALAALAIWGARDRIAGAMTSGEAVGSRRVAALVDPGYALLSDEASFAANVSAWREASMPARQSHGVWSGQGSFGARIRDPGVARSIDNDYLAVLVAREAGVGGLAQGIALLLVLVVAAGATATMRLSHGSRAQRTRWLVLGVVGTLAIYQPLAALGVVPLTGISWPGLGIDSPADLWIFALGAIWCLACISDGAPGAATEDERVRMAPRLVRAHRAVLAALGLAGLVAVIVVIRAGICATARGAAEDERIDRALRYAETLACPWADKRGALADVVPPSLTSHPSDAATARFDAELAIAWSSARDALLAAKPETIATCTGAVGGWQLSRSTDKSRESPACEATLAVGWPTVALSIAPPSAPGSTGYRATCRVELDNRAIGVLRPAARDHRPPRIRVVATALGVAATDRGELVAGSRVIRLRPSAPALALAAAADGITPASRVELANAAHAASSVTLETTARGVVLRGPAELYVARDGRPDDKAAWQRLLHGGEVILDRVTLIVAGPRDRRVAVVFRPARAIDGKPVVEALLADDTSRLGDRPRRVYPYGGALPELGWVNPFDLQRSMGLDGWIHAAHQVASSTDSATTSATNSATHGATDNATTMTTSCGTLTPAPIDRGRVCSTNPLDGVTECRITLQPELALELDRLASGLLIPPPPPAPVPPTKGKRTKPPKPPKEAVQPVRVAFVALRGDTGELLAQGNRFAGRQPLVYAPRDAAAEAELVRLRDERGESDRERVEWNQPIAVGSTLKPIVARAAERAFPGYTAALALGAVTEATGCKSRRGKRVSPILGHCPPTSVAGRPSTADLHDFLARSPNWYQATLGLAGLALPDGALAAGDTPISLGELIDSDLTAWPTKRALRITDASGATILGPRGLAIEALRRTPLWTNVEQLLGRPLCTLGDRASCERASDRRDLCAARALPIASPSADLRYLVALGPDRIDPYADDRKAQRTIPTREYLQLLRGAGVHPIGSLPQIADAFNRVMFDPAPGPSKLAASWFPAPSTGVIPSWSCSATAGHLPTVHGADGGLCGVLREGGTAQAVGGELLAIPHVAIYGAKTGTIDSLADIARRPKACEAWNARHPSAQLACGKTPPDDSLFVISFGVATPMGTIPVTFAIQLQRGGTGSAAKATPAFVRAIAAYLRG